MWFYFLSIENYLQLPLTWHAYHFPLHEKKTASKDRHFRHPQFSLIFCQNYSDSSAAVAKAIAIRRFTHNSFDTRTIFVFRQFCDWEILRIVTYRFCWILCATTWNAVPFLMAINWWKRDRMTTNDSFVFHISLASPSVFDLTLPAQKKRRREMWQIRCVHHMWIIWFQSIFNVIDTLLLDMFSTCAEVKTLSGKL